MMQDNSKDVIVYDPETNDCYNCTDIVDKLEKVYKYQPKEVFNHQIQVLNSCIQWDDNIEKQFSKLKSILEKNKLGSEFKNQLDKVVLYANRRNEVYKPMMKRFKELYMSIATQKGISFLCPELDKLTGGIMPGTICTIAGGPGCMKTTYAINIAYQAVKTGKNVCYLSLEESTTQLFSKLLSRVSNDINKEISVQDICQHRLEENKINILFDEVLPYLDNLLGCFDIIGEKDLISYEFSELERVLKLVDENMKSRNNDEHGIDILIIDHIQLLKYASNTKDEYKVMNDYVSFFRKQSLSFLGSEREISVILLSQINREGIAYAQKHNGNYLMQHVAEASEVERSSSYIISLYSDGAVQITKLLKVGAVKLRGSQLPLNTINIYADGEFYQVGDSSISESEDYSTADIFNDTVVPTDTVTQQYKSIDDALAGLGF